MQEQKPTYIRKLQLFWNKLRRPYRIVIINPFTFEEKRKWQLTRMNVFIAMTLLVFLIASATYLFIAYTPFKYSIPGYLTEQEQKRIERMDKENIERLDNLIAELEQKQLFIDNITAVLNGRVTTMPLDSTLQAQEPVNVEFPTSKEDSILRAQVSEEERLNLAKPIAKSGDKINLANILLFRPVDGKLTNAYNKEDGHMGIDIIAPESEPVKATLDGTIIFASWTSDNGYVIQIQHAYNLISVYKHNSVLLKKVGETVKSGEAISFIGNSGELSEGPHLHFELWQNGQALNPAEYISF
ncbi:MAG: peptidoglycan DD-metalloendopeptidase family protein [Bacteroidia bacterium]